MIQQPSHAMSNEFYLRFQCLVILFLSLNISPSCPAISSADLYDSSVPVKMSIDDLTLLPQYKEKSHKSSVFLVVKLNLQVHLSLVFKSELVIGI